MPLYMDIHHIEGGVALALPVARMLATIRRISRAVR